LPEINWSYVSGFFDGEGGISVFGRIGSNALALKATVCQKSLEVLTRIRTFLLSAGILSVIYTYSNGMNSLEVGRADDLMKFLRSLKSLVKARQVSTALDYLGGKITGNTLLKMYEEEYIRHKRKNSPMRSLGLRFPMTRAGAVEAAGIKSARARHEGHRRRYLERMRARVLALPPTFGVRDIQSALGLSKPRAQFIGKKMVDLGLVSCHFERIPPRFRKKVFERL
jgi:hypothetical protein